jgi:hypothetical protein
MSGPSITGGGSFTADDVLVLLYNRTGVASDNGIGCRFELAFGNTEVT